MLHAGAQPPFAGSRRRIGRNVADETLRRVELAHRYADLGGMRLRYVEAGKGLLVLLLQGVPRACLEAEGQDQRVSQSGSLRPPGPRFRALLPTSGAEPAPSGIGVYTLLRSG
jgi:hypothetical protein